MASDMFTADEACRFVSQKLKVENVRERMASDRRSLLDDITAAMHTELLFQNIRGMLTSLKRRPTLEEIKADILSGAGGVCYNLNTATFYLLKALGFDVVLVRAKVLSTVMRPSNHIIVHARNVEKPGDAFLVDIGTGFPTFRAISLDFEKESPVYRGSFHEYKFIRHEGKILRMHRDGNQSSRGHLFGIEFHIVDGWFCFFLSETSGTTNIEEFYTDFDEVFTSPTLTPFHTSLRVIGFPGKRAVMVINDKTLIENDSGDLVKTLIPGGDEGIAAEVKRLFPVLPLDDIKRAITEWRTATKSS